ncbi:MAG: DUF1593 domain-containing protein [Cyclobacteriaceae bacterium]
MLKSKIAFFFFFSFLVQVSIAQPKYRLIVLADMGNEPDEMQQITHLLMYNNEIDIEGLIAVSGIWLRPDFDGPAYKGIIVMDGGTLELHGKKRKSWTNIAATADAGSSQITLKEAVEWEVGDIIALTSTDLAMKANNNQKGTLENVDESEITGISEDKKMLTLKSPLKYKHVGGSKSYTRDTDGKIWDVDIFGEVGLLSHYIKIQGAKAGTQSCI